MVGETRIIAFGHGNGDPDSHSGAADDEVLLTADMQEQETADTYELVEDYRSETPGGVHVPAILAVSAGVVWTAFFLWANSGSWPSGQDLSGWTGLAADWAVPVLLIAVVWLLAMRNSRREAARFAGAARMLSTESAALEARLSTVNSELSLAREFIAAQSRDLDSLGRQATERLSEHAERLQALVQENGSRIESLGTVSETALGNMEKLRGQLPVIASSAKDVTNNIGNAGRTAHSQLSELINGFKRLNEFGQASERQVMTLRSAVDEAIGEFERQARQLDHIADNRFAALAERGAEFRTQLETHEVDALAAIRNRAGALAEELTQTREALDSQEEQALTSLRARLASLRDEGNAIARSVRDGETRALDDWREAVARIEEQLGTTIAALDAAETSATEAIRARIEELTQSIAALEAQVGERSRGFAEEIERRRADAERADLEVLQRMSDQLGAFDDKALDRGRKLSEAIVSHRETAEVADSAALERFEAHLAALDQRIAERTNSLTEDLDRRRNEAEQLDSDVLQRLSQRLRQVEDEIARRNQLLTDEIERRRLEADALEQDALERLSGRLAKIDAQVSERRVAQEQQARQLDQHGAAFLERVAQFDDRLTSVASHGTMAEARLSASIQSLDEKLAASQGALAGTESEIATLTDSSVRLLELLQASAEQTGKALPEAISRSEEGLAALEGRLGELVSRLDQGVARGDDLKGLVENSGTRIGSICDDIEKLNQTVSEHREVNGAKLGELRDALEAIEQQSDRIAEKAKGELAEALESLQSSVHDAIAAMREDGAAAVSGLAEQLGSESATALERAMRASAAETSGQIELAASHAAGVGREAAIQLRDQLAKVNELVGNLERRVNQARERAEEQVDNDFSRRAALITDSLNSNAIDIAKALSEDVADTAWSSYLRGDRGIFTRRAVSLLETGQAREIAHVYEQDGSFREHVSRYIHDFEAILRQVLSTRDGHALGVTILSSDMGKLYVALAQAIERLRD
ncbi:MAG: ATPase [Novosphingobium sp.]|nr:ATPase [Novosphingobium sp.]